MKSIIWIIIIASLLPSIALAAKVTGTATATVLPADPPKPQCDPKTQQCNYE